MKIYTRKGDRGQTALFGGNRVGKDDVRVRAYGDIDECNAAIGLARAVGTDEEIEHALARLQHELFNLGAEIATPPDASKAAREKTTLIDSATIARLEAEIDRFTEELPELKQFILPGGGISSATIHYARTVSRRAERSLATLHAVEPVRDEAQAFMNRLSDLLFTLARLANHRAGLPETHWDPKGGGDE